MAVKKVAEELETYPIEKVEFWGNRLALFKEELEMGEGRNSVLLGRFLVEIPNGRQGIRIFNLTRVACGGVHFYGHPCVEQDSGQVCWGGFNRALGKLFREGNLLLIIDLIFEFLETWSEANPIVKPGEWEDDAEEFPREEGERLVAARKKRALENLGAVQEGAHESLYNVQTPSGMTGQDQVNRLLGEEYRRQMEQLQSAVGQMVGQRGSSWRTTTANTVPGISPSISVSSSMSHSESEDGENEDGWNFEL